MAVEDLGQLKCAKGVFSLLAETWPFILFALWGGAASYMARLREGPNKHFSVFELLGDFVISGFSGMLVYLLAHEAGFSEWMTAAMVGIGGHLGSRTVFVVERFARRRLAIESGISPGDSSTNPG